MSESEDICNEVLIEETVNLPVEDEEPIKEIMNQVLRAPNSRVNQNGVVSGKLAPILDDAISLYNEINSFLQKHLQVPLDIRNFELEDSGLLPEHSISIPEESAISLVNLHNSAFVILNTVKKTDNQELLPEIEDEMKFDTFKEQIKKLLCNSRGKSQINSTQRTVGLVKKISKAFKIIGLEKNNKKTAPSVDVSDAACSTSSLSSTEYSFLDINRRGGVTSSPILQRSANNNSGDSIIPQQKQVEI